MNDATQPIGIFDSGIGGLTVARAVASLMPEENIIYFGDTAHLPYGDKSAATLQTYALHITDMLLARQCKLILIACNSAASAAGHLIRTHVQGRALVQDVIDPIVQWLATTPPQHKIGLIGTRRTVGSDIYRERLNALQPGRELVCQATNLLASAIEEFGNHGVIDRLLEEYLSGAPLEGIESLILACTHYPVIKEKITAFFGGKVKVIDPSATVANATESLLLEHQLRNLTGTGEKHFYISDMTDAFIAGARFFFEEPLRLEHYPFEKLEHPHELSSPLACREFC